jgi:ubiquinone/menaquinone biosynthesis C-methylase UbiE
MGKREEFYTSVVEELIKSKTDTILICGAGFCDTSVFDSLGFVNVTISNLDTRTKPGDYLPYKWSFQNAESLSFNDNSFDYVVIHAAIHHASSPHKVLTEMYRVAKKGVLAFESRDSLLMRYIEKFNITQIYEHAAVYYNDCNYGGMNNTEIPNFVYRWTEREIEKTIQAYAPYCEHNYIYRYSMTFPSTARLEKKNKLKILFLISMQPFYWLFIKVFKKQQNLFAFFIEKPDFGKNLFPWLIYKDDQLKFCFNKKWGDERYKKNS